MDTWNQPRLWACLLPNHTAPHICFFLCPAAKEGATAVKRATGAKAGLKSRGSLWSSESVAALKAMGAATSRKKSDGWAFSRAPAHTGGESVDTPPRQAPPNV